MGLCSEWLILFKGVRKEEKIQRGQMTVVQWYLLSSVALKHTTINVVSQVKWSCDKIKFMSNTGIIITSQNMFFSTFFVSSTTF